MRNPTGTQEVMHVSFQVCSKRKQDSPGRRGVRYPQVNSAVHRYSTISGWYPSDFFMSSCLSVQPMFPITRTSFWNPKILSLRCQTEFNEKGEKSPEACFKPLVEFRISLNRAFQNNFLNVTRLVVTPDSQVQIHNLPTSIKQTSYSTCRSLFKYL